METSAPPRPRELERWIVRALALVAGLAAGAAVVPSMMLPFVSLFLFDDPAANSMIQPYLLMVIMWAIPALLVGSVVCSVFALVRPSWRSLRHAIGLAAIPLIFSVWFFDPLKLRHYPPGQTCGRESDRTGREQWVCRPWPPTGIQH